MIRAFQWDLARQVERLACLQRLLPRYAAWGYQELYLHLEDAVHYPSLPGIGRPDAYTQAELGALVRTATRCGIRVVPIVNLLGHTQYLITHPDLRDLNELRDPQGGPLATGQVCPLHPRLPEVAARLLRDVAPFCTAGKVHVGLDESFHLGRCPRCRAEVARIGLGGHFATHVHRLHRLVTALSLEMGLWADMLYFVPEAIPQLPKGITAYDWYYYPFNRKPRVEFFNFAERDLQPALRKHGIRYYGCPMNGAFRYEPLPVFGDRLANIRSWWQRCQAIGADGLLVTSWEAYRLALETTTTVDAAAANLWLEPAQDDATAMLTRGLERAQDSTHARAQARALLAADEHAFAGYARWQINDRWDVFAGRDSLKPYLADVAFYERLLAGSYDWPPAFSSSLAFRLYLARRDVFVRRAARQVFQWRRLLAKGDREQLKHSVDLAQVAATSFAADLREGLRAARAMWARSRQRGQTGQNEVILRTDLGRLASWRTWLRRVRRNPDGVTGASPVCGAWQVQLLVHNFAPAVQRVIIEAQDPTGGWREIVGRHTIEFRAQAARPATRLKRELTAPVPTAETRLRVRLTGVGQVGLSHLALTNGSRIMPARLPGRSRVVVLGSPAPRKGFPEYPAADEGHILLLNFTPAERG